MAALGPAKVRFTTAAPATRTSTPLHFPPGRQSTLQPLRVVRVDPRGSHSIRRLAQPASVRTCRHVVQRGTGGRERSRQERMPDCGRRPSRPRDRSCGRSNVLHCQCSTSFKLSCKYVGGHRSRRTDWKPEERWAWSILSPQLTERDWSASPMGQRTVAQDDLGDV